MYKRQLSGCAGGCLYAEREKAGSLLDLQEVAGRRAGQCNGHVLIGFLLRRDRTEEDIGHTAKVIAPHRAPAP